MEFGLFIPQGWRFDLVGIEPARQWATMRDLVQAADRNPDWASAWVYDHFHTTPEPSDQATHEAWTLMAAFAAATDRIRLGQMCSCMAYRNPAYLAKVAATIDHVSGGRIEMGIGAGWYEHEWRAYGYGFPEPRERLRHLGKRVRPLPAPAHPPGVRPRQQPEHPRRPVPRQRDLPLVVAVVRDRIASRREVEVVRVPHPVRDDRHVRDGLPRLVDVEPQQHARLRLGDGTRRVGDDRDMIANVGLGSSAASGVLVFGDGGDDTLQISRSSAKGSVGSSIYGGDGDDELNIFDGASGHVGSLLSGGVQT